MDEKVIKIIGNLYWTQLAAVIVDVSKLAEIEICCGVRQGCVFFPTLSIPYSEKNKSRDACRTEGD